MTRYTKSLLTSRQRKANASAAAHQGWSHYPTAAERSARTSKARATFEAAFFEQAREQAAKRGQTLSEAEIALVASHLRAAFFARIRAARGKRRGTR